MLGEELKKARIAANLTQESLSFEAGLDRTYISHLENNKKSPTIDVLGRICKAVGIPMSELLARVEKAERTPGKKSKKA